MLHPGQPQKTDLIGPGQPFTLLSVQTGLYCTVKAIPSTFPLSVPRRGSKAAGVRKQAGRRSLQQLPVTPECFTQGLVCDQPTASTNFTFTGEGMEYQGQPLVQSYNTYTLLFTNISTCTLVGGDVYMFAPATTAGRCHGGAWGRLRGWDGVLGHRDLKCLSCTPELHAPLTHTRLGLLPVPPCPR